MQRNKMVTVTGQQAHLVLDEGDQWADHHRNTLRQDCRQLVAQALACSQRQMPLL